MIDPCSEGNFISEILTQRLRLPRRFASLHISGVGASKSGVSKGIVNLLILSRLPSRFTLETEALVIPRLSNYTPSHRVAPQPWPELNGLDLADPKPSANSAIHLLLGAEIYALIIRPGLMSRPDNRVVAQDTTMGWILTGRPTGSTSKVIIDEDKGQTVQSKPVISMSCAIEDALSIQLQRFWEQEEVAVPASALLTAAEQFCEQRYETTHLRDSDGRYIVRLPLKGPISELGDSRAQAELLFLKLERRLLKNPDLRAAYAKFMSDYLSLGHMELADSTLSPNVPRVYLPHHGVFKETSTTTKLRVVFNGSHRTSTGSSLNDYQHTGPKLHSELSDILLRWRMFAVVFSADIEKMFLQIKIHPDDQDCQRILWRFDPTNEPIREYRMTTVTFGLSSSPYLALRTIQQLVTDEGHRWPHAASILPHHIYIDDVLAGADDVESALTLQQELINLLQSGGFPLRKWASNEMALVKSVPEDWKAKSQSLSWHDGGEFHTLGLTWQPAEDELLFRTNVATPTAPCTKRRVLSDISKLFDPLGLISPVIIVFKILMQNLWLIKIGWDDPLPEEIFQRWIRLFENLRHLDTIRIPRWLGHSNGLRLVELHGFADASKAAYAAVLYLRTVSHQGVVRSSLICSKSKVTPIKQLSIPKLELCGAQLLARLALYIQKTLSFEDVKVHLWTDSTNVIAWLRCPPCSWYTFVANRVSYIQTSLPDAYWHHIPGIENPADCATRGLSARQLGAHSLWWVGPDRLTETDLPWSTFDPNLEVDTDLERRVVIHQATVAHPYMWYRFAHCASSLGKLTRVTAWCIRYINNLKECRIINRSYPYAHPRVLTPAELNHARLYWLPKSDPLIKLNPFLDAQQLLRVGGRLKHSVLDPDERHPYILPSTSPLTDLIVDSCHQRTFHGGTQLTLATLRRQFWILRGRQVVKSRILRCVVCIRHRAATAVQLMGNLPSNRVQRSRAFLHSGVDFAGPIRIRAAPGRGQKSYKGYIAVFVCTSTRAVHLEAVSNYTSLSFLAAYRRFTSRRGICSTLTSDQGTNFVGADAELRALFAEASSTSQDIADALAMDQTTWLFVPPSAPHFGGLWEAAVKSTKHHLKRVIGTSTLTFEELSTVLSQIEACLNSRPLQAITDDPSDLSALTPGHWLIGGPLTAVPEPSLIHEHVPANERWKMVQKMQEDFWHRWSSEYLHSLQTLPKWRQRQQSVQVGDLAILKESDETIPPTKWPLCRVTEVYPGEDGLVRAVTVRTATTELERPIVKLCLLPRAKEDLA